MSMKFFAALAATAAAVSATSADAQVFLYEVVGTVPGKFTARFQFDTTRAPSIVLNDSIRYNGVPITYTLPNSTTPITESGQFDGVTFSTTQNQGGFFYGFLDGAPNFNNRIQLFGAPLFSGTTSSPTFLTGVFNLSDIPPNGAALQPNYRLTVTNLAQGAVPEPATWAMMIVGFGAVGGAMRRRTTTRVRFA